MAINDDTMIDIYDKIFTSAFHFYVTTCKVKKCYNT